MNELKSGNEKILVAEDEEPMRELIRDILEGEGYDVIQVADGEEAVRTYLERKDEIALVILDMIMPKMSGEDVFRELKRADPNVLILLSSGYTENGDMRELLHEGLAWFLGKPYQVNELLAKVRMVLGSETKV